MHNFDVNILDDVNLVDEKFQKLYIIVGLLIFNFNINTNILKFKNSQYIYSFQLQYYTS